MFLANNYILGRFYSANVRQKNYPADSKVIEGIAEICRFAMPLAKFADHTTSWPASQRFDTQ